MKVNKYEVVNKFLLAGNKFMPKMHLRQPGFTYRACGPFTFEQDMAYGDFNYSARRTASDKILRDKAFNIAKNQKWDGYQRGIASMVYKCFDKKKFWPYDYVRPAVSRRIKQINY